MYGYDKIQQLTSFKRGKEQGGAVTLPTRMQTFRYDALGNRISAEEDGKTTNYAVNNVNEYTEIRGELAFTPQYDANGNMVKDEAHTYRYDYNNKLVQVDENTATYTYDALGRRISKKTAEGTVNFFYAGDDVIEEQDGSKVLLATYLIGNGIDDMIKMNRKGNDYFYHTNHLGSVMAVSDRAGIVQERYEYDPFGKVSFYNGVGTLLAKSAIANEVLFTGRSYNGESGLYDYRARAMKPNIGRFVQVDPLLYMNGMNYYSYTNNNSIIFIDPYGLYIDPNSLKGYQDIQKAFDELKAKEKEILDILKNNPNKKVEVSTQKNNILPKSNDNFFQNPSSDLRKIRNKLNAELPKEIQQMRGGMKKPFGLNVKSSLPPMNNVADQIVKQESKVVSKQLMKQGMKRNPAGVITEVLIVLGIGAINAAVIANMYGVDFSGVYKDIIGGYMDSEYGFLNNFLPQKECVK